MKNQLVDKYTKRLSHVHGSGGSKGGNACEKNQLYCRKHGLNKDLLENR